MAQETINVGAVANDRTGDTWRDAMIKSNSNFTELYAATPSSVVVVTNAAGLTGVLDSTKLYIIDGQIDMGSQSIEVPIGGLNLRGYNFNVSGLYSSVVGYTMFTSPVGGSGDLLGTDFSISVTGAASRVYGLVDANGSHAVEIINTNYINCVSLGDIDNYRQGLETNTGRFGGTPSLTLTGAWAGGFLITTSIVRGIDNAMTDALFKAGTGFVMQSRFRNNMNVDLGTLAPLVDFSPTNIPNPSTLQLEGMIVTRNGVADAGDTTIYPSINSSDLSSQWADNIGLPNTHVGGDLGVTTEVETVIATVSTFVFLNGTWTATDLQHFDSPTNGQIRHLGDNPRDYKVVGDILIDGGPNDEIEIRIRKFDSSSSTTTTEGSQVRVVNNFQGGRDVAIFNFNKHVMLDQNDYIFLEVANNTDTSNVTAELDSSILVEAR